MPRAPAALSTARSGRATSFTNRVSPVVRGAAEIVVGDLPKQHLLETLLSARADTGVVDPAPDPASGGRDDLTHEGAKVPVRAPVGELALRPGAAFDQLDHGLELASRAELARMRPEPLDEAPGELARRDPRALRKVDELAAESVACRKPFVLLEQLVRERAELESGFVVLRE